ncbi:MAG: hypothetical protein J3K34DRAFT_440211 [Monoraphidium minutum]|nr:MAG: hypothetical protein J3K34DRAFT_440211 [Monoraphidium minutum]
MSSARGTRLLLSLRAVQQSCQAGSWAAAAAAGPAVWPAQRRVKRRAAALPSQQHGAPWLPLGLRGFQTKAPSEIANTQSLLDSLQAAKLRDELVALSEEKPYITYHELIDFIKKSNAADTDAEAEERADALTRAGVVLRLNSVVYLRPEEVAEMVYRAVPTNPAEARQRLEESERELTQMEEAHRAIQRAATRWPRFWLNAGCVALFVQLTGFVYLTYWELSWDVMEPIAYMLSLTYSWLAYVYYLSKGSELDYGSFQKFWTGQQLRKKMDERGFNLDRYQSLARQIDRNRRYLAAQAEAERVGNKI